jgi:protein-tyrosine-phosphatase
MAAGILRLKLANENDWQIGSAGTWAAEGQIVLPEVLEVMTQRGIDLSHHRARMISDKLLRISNLILVMEPAHHEAITSEFPGVSSRIFLLSEMCGRWQPVLDPVGGTLQDYQNTANELDRLITQGLERIRYLARVE